MYAARRNTGLHILAGQALLPVLIRRCYKKTAQEKKQSGIQMDVLVVALARIFRFFFEAFVIYSRGEGFPTREHGRHIRAEQLSRSAFTVSSLNNSSSLFFSVSYNLPTMKKVRFCSSEVMFDLDSALNIDLRVGVVSSGLRRLRVRQQLIVGFSVKRR